MIKPWQVWNADLWKPGLNPVVVVSSEFHLRLSVGRVLTVAPLTANADGVDYRVKITDPRDGGQYWFICDMLRTIDSVHLEGHEPVWELAENEIAEARFGMKMMVAF